MKELESIREKLQANENAIRDLQNLMDIKKHDLKRIIEKSQNEIREVKINLQTAEEQGYILKEKELHIIEIFRQAKIHFPLLRNDPSSSLTVADVAELDKWIGRTKTIDGLKSIITAIKSVGSKYTAKGIHSNLYALIQKVIIEGPKDMRKK